MSWFILAIASTLSLTVATLYLRLTMKDEESDPFSFSIVFQFALTLIIGTYAVYKGFVFPPANLWPQYLLSAVLYATGTYCGFVAAKKLGASEVTILSTTGSVIAIILGILFLHESFGPIRLLGAILILSSIIFLFANKKLNFSNGIWFAVLSSVLYSLAGVNDVTIIRVYDPVSYVALISFLPGVILCLIKPKALLRLKPLLKVKSLTNMLLFCFFYGIQAITYYLALSHGAGISQMNPISKSEIILVVLFAAIFLGEREHMKKKIISAVLVTIGVLLLT